MFRMNVNKSPDSFKVQDEDLQYGKTVNFLFNGAFMQGTVVAKNGTNVAVRTHNGVIIVQRNLLSSNKMF